MFSMKQEDVKIENLIEDYGSDVLRTAFVYVKNMTVAEDIFQEVFIKVINNIDSFQGKSSIKTWIIKITINTCKDYLKSAWNRRVVPIEDYQEYNIEAKNDFQDVYDIDRNNLVREKVLSLQDKYKDVIICVYFNEMTLEETSRFLKIPIGTVKSRLSRARTKLKELLEGRGYNEL